MVDRPNILVVMSDDHGQWCAGCYGNREVRTPTMDWLAASGVRMAESFTPTPVCSPARASFWTGRLPSQHGLHDYLFERDDQIGQHDWMAAERTLAAMVQDAGYHTALCGKWHCGRGMVPQPGFDRWFSMGRGTAQARGVHTWSDQGNPVELAGSHSNHLTDQAVRVLRERPTDQPFFLFCGYTITHSRWADGPEWLVDQYRQASFGDIPADPVYPFGRLAGESVGPTRFAPREAQAQYYAAATDVDRQLSRLLDELDSQGVLSETLVVYTSDHGLNTGHHGVWGKGNGTRPLNMLEESIRIPMLFGGWRELFGGQTRSEFVDHCDLFATLSEATGVEPEPTLQTVGRSFLPALTRATALPDWKQVQTGEYGNLRMARDHQHKLVRRYPAGPDELFDLLADPREGRNCLGDPSKAAVVARLDQAIAEQFQRFDDGPASGLRVAVGPRHNPVEAWRGEPD